MLLSTWSRGPDAGIPQVQAAGERERSRDLKWGKVFGFYHSKVDSRVWVRKPHPWMGWSLNMAKPLTRVRVLLFILLFCLFVASMVSLVVHR